MEVCLLQPVERTEAGAEEPGQYFNHVPLAKYASRLGQNMPEQAITAQLGDRWDSGDFLLSTGCGRDYIISDEVVRGMPLDRIVYLWEVSMQPMACTNLRNALMLIHCVLFGFLRRKPWRSGLGMTQTWCMLLIRALAVTALRYPAQDTVTRCTSLLLGLQEIVTFMGELLAAANGDSQSQPGAELPVQLLCLGMSAACHSMPACCLLMCGGKSETSSGVLVHEAW